MRALWYQYMVALEDVYTQHHGVVLVVFGATDGKYTMFEGKSFYYTDGLPYRINAMHICVFNRKLNAIEQLIGWRLDKYVRMRIRRSAVHRCR